MKKYMAFIQKISIICLVSCMTIALMQHHSFTTFAANTASVGAYVNTDFTKESNTIDMVKNSPENKIEKPAVEETTATAYQSLLQEQWKEKKELRTENTKVLEDKSGTQKTLLYMGAIHYLDKNNKWQEYNTNLKSSKGRSGQTAYQQTASNVEVTIPTTITKDTPIAMKIENSNLLISKEEPLKDPKVTNNTLLYGKTKVTTIGPGIQISEQFTVDLPTELTYIYKVDEGSQLLTDETKGAIQLLDKQQQLVTSINAPKVLDANGEPYGKATIESTLLTKDSYTIKITLPSTKANAPSYPIDVVTTTATLVKGSVAVHGMNSHKPDATYGPGHGTVSCRYVFGW